jgi:hypothetical protein
MDEEDFGFEPRARWWRVWVWRGISGFILSVCFDVAVRYPMTFFGDGFVEVVFDTLRSPLDPPLSFVFWTVFTVAGIVLLMREVQDWSWADELALGPFLCTLGFGYLCMYAARHHWFLPLQWDGGFWWLVSRMFYDACILGAALNLWFQLAAGVMLWIVKRGAKRRGQELNLDDRYADLAGDSSGGADYERETTLDDAG